MTGTDKHASTVEYNDNNPWRNEETLRRLYFGDGRTLPEIADHFGITHQAVIYWFDKHGIERRDVADYWNRDDLRTPIKKVRQAVFCSNCGGTFKIHPSKAGTRRYCSQECAKADYSKSEYVKERVSCLECSDTFKGYPHRKFCSHDCYADNLYRGGSTLSELFRKKERARGWIDAVFERDDYTCQRCGDRGGELQAHHVVPVAEIADGIDGRDSIMKHELFNDTSNGQTLCIDCHDHIHYGGTEQ